MIHFTIPIVLIAIMLMVLAAFLYFGFGLFLIGRNSDISITKIYAFALPVLTFVITVELFLGIKNPSNMDKITLFVAMGFLIGGAAFYSKTKHDGPVKL